MRSLNPNSAPRSPLPLDVPSVPALSISEAPFLRSALLMVAFGCGPREVIYNNTYPTSYYSTGEATDAPENADTGLDPYAEAPEATVSSEDLEIDLFDDGNRFYAVFETQERLDALNEEYENSYSSNGYYGAGELEDGGANDPTYADDFFVTSAQTGDVAQYGCTDLQITGESTGTYCDENSLCGVKMNINGCSDHEDVRVDGYDEWFFKSEIYGGMQGRDLASKVINEMSGVHRSTAFAWFGNNIPWGYSEPYVTFQAYDGDFGNDFGVYYGGDVSAIYKGTGDFGEWWEPLECALKDCSAATDSLSALEDVIASFDETAVDTGWWFDAPPGGGDGIDTGGDGETGSSEGFMEATRPYLDWDSDVGILANMCDSDLIGDWDNWKGNSNNVWLIYGKDGLFRYGSDGSTDLTWGEWNEAEVVGYAKVARYCQNDSNCVEALWDRCEERYEAFVAADPLAILDDRYATLVELGMKRDGDDLRYGEIYEWVSNKLETFPEDIANYRRCGWKSYGEPCDADPVETSGDTGSEPYDSATPIDSGTPDTALPDTARPDSADTY